jgi:arginase
MPGSLRLLVMPFHNGLEGVGMGAGPDRLVAAGVSGALEEAGLGVELERIAPADPAAPELARVAELDRRLARAVAAAAGRGEFPLVLAGNCNSSLGTVAGAGAEGLGVVWFDAHADFDAPDESLGFFDGMGLRILTGTGFRHLRETIPGFAAIPEQDVVLAGVRDLEPHQVAPLAASRVARVHGGPWDHGRLAPALDALRARRSRAYLHIDLDALDPAEGRANPFAAPGGLRLDELEDAVGEVFARFEVAAAALTAYDPSVDEEGAVARAARRLARAVAEGAAAQAQAREG